MDWKEPSRALLGAEQHHGQQLSAWRALKHAMKATGRKNPKIFKHRPGAASFPLGRIGLENSQSQRHKNQHGWQKGAGWTTSFIERLWRSLKYETDSGSTATRPLENSVGQIASWMKLLQTMSEKHQTPRLHNPMGELLTHARKQLERPPRHGPWGYPPQNPGKLSQLDRPAHLTGPDHDINKNSKFYWQR